MSRFTKISNQVIGATDIDVNVDKENGTIDVEFINSGELIAAYFTPAEAKRHIRNLQKAVGEFTRHEIGEFKK